MFSKVLLLPLAVTVLQLAACDNWDSELIAQYGKIDVEIVKSVRNKTLAAIAELDNRINELDVKFQRYQKYEMNMLKSFKNWVESEMKSLEERSVETREKGLDMIEDFQPIIEEIHSCNADDIQTSMQEFQAKVNAHISFYETFMEDIMDRFQNCVESPFLDCELLIRSEFESLKQGPKDLYRVNADGASLSLLRLDINMCVVRILARNEARFMELAENLKNLDL